MMKAKAKGGEFEYPDTLFVRDIDNRVFQNLVAKSLSLIGGVELAEGGLIDNILQIANPEGIKGIVVRQDSENHSVSIKVEVKISYGLSIPQKAEEIQARIAQEVTEYTGLHVSEVHLVIRDIVMTKPKEVISTTRSSEPDSFNTV